MEAQSLLTRTINTIRAGSGLIVLSHFILIDFHIYQGVLPESQSGNQKRGKHNTQIISLPQNYVFCFICESEYQALRRSADSGLSISLYSSTSSVGYGRVFLVVGLNLYSSCVFFSHCKLNANKKASKFSNLG